MVEQKCSPSGPLRRYVKLGQICQRVLVVFAVYTVLYSSPSPADEGHDHKPAEAAQEHQEDTTKRRGKVRKGAGGEGSCQANVTDMARVAVGEIRDMSSVVGYVTAPECNDVAKLVSAQAAAFNINFSNSYPYRLDQFSKDVGGLSDEGFRAQESKLAELTEEWIRSYPLSYKEFAPMVGQLAFLSPKAARRGVAELIRLELMSEEASQKGRGSIVAKSLLKLGAQEPAISAEFGNMVEQMAVQSQAESLRVVLSSLTNAASGEAKLISTLSIAASAFSRGIQRATDIYSPEGNKQMSMTAFQVASLPGMATVALKPAAGEINEALAALLEKGDFEKNLGKKLWKETLSLLARTATQRALASAVATSLNSDLVYLPADQRSTLLVAARNYPDLALAIQAHALTEWKGLKEDAYFGKLNPNALVAWREKYVRPLVAGVLELDVQSIDAEWLREVWRDGMISEAEVEGRFPMQYLGMVERHERQIAVAAEEPTVENSLASIAESFSMMWSMSHVQLPALFELVDKQSE